MAKIIIGGPAQSGKSCLRAGLREALMAVSRRRGTAYPYVITACPDGEGSWYTETGAKDPELAKALKAAYKAKFTPEFVSRVAESVRLCQETLTFVDLGGKITPENRQICATATHAVLIAGDKDEVGWQERMAPWFEFCKELGIQVVAVLFSDYHGSEDKFDGVDGEVFCASVHFLDRKVEPREIGQRPSVVALAEFLAERFGKE
jgi:CRISPR-associated protein Csx3